MCRKIMNMYKFEDKDTENNLYCTYFGFSFMLEHDSAFSCLFSIALHFFLEFMTEFPKAANKLLFKCLPSLLFLSYLIKVILYTCMLN